MNTVEVLIIYAILNGYDQKQKLFKVIWVNKTVTIEKNTQVVTSGLGELFPAGIYVGTVEKVETDKYNLSQTLYIKNDQNFNSIHYVTVLKGTLGKKRDLIIYHHLRDILVVD